MPRTTFPVQKRPAQVNEKYKPATIRGQKMCGNECIKDLICLIAAGGKSSSGNLKNLHPGATATQRLR